jgi:hypothetical protein
MNNERYGYRGRLGGDRLRNNLIREISAEEDGIIGGKVTVIMRGSSYKLKYILFSK